MNDTTPNTFQVLHTHVLTTLSRMAVLYNLLNAFGLALLAHSYAPLIITISLRLTKLTHPSVYSAHEHTVLHAHTSPLTSTTPESASSTGQSSLPLDIVIELLVAVFVLCLGIVGSSMALKPIEWRKWAGEVEKSARAENPFRILEERTGFWDVREKRAEFAEWVREGGK